MKRKNIYILILIFLLCLSIPIIGIFKDFGQGSDDAASKIIEQSIGHGKAMNIDYFGYVPSDQSEPWLFVLQIMIGVVVFLLAFILLRKYREQHKH